MRLLMANLRSRRFFWFKHSHNADAGRGKLIEEVSLIVKTVDDPLIDKEA